MLTNQGASFNVSFLQYSTKLNYIPAFLLYLWAIERKRVLSASSDCLFEGGRHAKMEIWSISR